VPRAALYIGLAIQQLSALCTRAAAGRGTDGTFCGVDKLVDNRARRCAAQCANRRSDWL